MNCVQCGNKLPETSPSHRKYCGSYCKARWRTKHPAPDPGFHVCRICATRFAINKDQGNKWLCSAKCIRTSNAKSVREFHLRRPQQEAIYRARSLAKHPSDSSHTRFKKQNPNAPDYCESCGETRILEVAHKPGKWRIGAPRNKANWKWPKMVWVLCPTCHQLLDRGGYTPKELGL